MRVRFIGREGDSALCTQLDHPAHYVYSSLFRNYYITYMPGAYSMRGFYSYWRV